MPWSSNGTYLAEASLDDDAIDTVYKPGRGERPLWDFPTGLYRREVAALRAVGGARGGTWYPPTVLRADGPWARARSSGSSTPTSSSTTSRWYENEIATDDRLRTICAFDLLANNTDRKSGHCLIGRDGTSGASTTACASTPSSSCAR